MAISDNAGLPRPAESNSLSTDNNGRPAAAPSVGRHAAPLAEVVRGATVESVHLGHVAVVDATGRLLYSAGDPHALTYTRSALKPLQALPFVLAGGIQRFGYALPEVAMLCASHSGEPRHVAAAGDMLARCGCVASELQCGNHVPYFYDALGEFPPPPPYSPLAHNCSGKHAGMLACCVLHGWSRGDYVDAGHPLQRAIRAHVARVCHVAEEALVEGTDGCSAPNYAVPLASLAHAYAQLATADAHADDADTAALGRLGAAMRAHPEMVSGEKRNDLTLAHASAGDWIGKAGAEGVQAVGIVSRGWGIAIKVADGHARGLAAATVAILDQLGLIDVAMRPDLEKFARPTLRNIRGIPVGFIQPAVQLVAATAAAR
jgi:L-asparaginase II